MKKKFVYYVSYVYITSDSMHLLNFGSCILDRTKKITNKDEIVSVREYIASSTPNCKECIILNYILMNTEN